MTRLKSAFHNYVMVVLPEFYEYGMETLFCTYLQGLIQDFCWGGGRDYCRMILVSLCMYSVYLMNIAIEGPKKPNFKNFLRSLFIGGWGGYSRISQGSPLSV